MAHLSALDAQLISRWECMKVCSTSTIRSLAIVATALLALISFAALVNSFGEEIGTAISWSWYGFWDLIGNLLARIHLSFLLAMFAEIFTKLAKETISIYEHVAAWLPIFDVTTLNCVDTKVMVEVDGKSVEQMKEVCTPTSTTNYLALAAAGSWVIIIGGLILTLFISLVTAVLLTLLHACVLKTYDLEKHMQRTVNTFCFGLFVIAAIWGAVAISIAILQPFATSMVESYTGEAYYRQSIGHIWLAGIFMVLPMFVLLIARDHSLGKTKRDLELQADAVNANDQIKEGIKALKEPFYVWIPNFVLVILAGIAFLLMVQAGSSIAPTGWEHAGGLIAGIIGLLLIGSTMAGVLTCYVDLRKPVQRLYAQIQQQQEQLAAALEAPSS